MREAVDEHGAAAAVVLLIDHERQEVELLAENGYPPAALEVLRRFPLDAPIPAAEAARTSSPVLVGTLAERRLRVPAAAGRARRRIGGGRLPAAQGHRARVRRPRRALGGRARVLARRAAVPADARGQLLARARARAAAQRDAAALRARAPHRPRRCRRASCPPRFRRCPGSTSPRCSPRWARPRRRWRLLRRLREGRRPHRRWSATCAARAPAAAKLTSLCRYTLRTAGMLTDCRPPRDCSRCSTGRSCEQAPEAPFSTVVLADLAPGPSTARCAP